MIRYALKIDPRWEAHARYALELLLEGGGLACMLVEDEGAADIVYSPTPPAAGPLWIRADHVDNWDDPAPQLAWLDTLPILYQTLRPEESGLGARLIEADIVYSAYSLVTGALERSLPKDAWGVPIFASSRPHESGLLKLPIIAMYAEFLLERLRRRAGSSSSSTAIDPVPRWPGGKKHAVILSHDVDDPFSTPRPGYFLRRARTSAARRDWGRVYSDMRQWAAMTMVRRYKPPAAERDPNFCFGQWLEIGRELGVTACFYVAVVSSAESCGAPNDVAYDFRHPAITGALRRAAQAGWEIGLHASINAKFSSGRLAGEKQLLESRLDGYTVEGLRHHYWSMDAETPDSTLWSHHAAGFKYDSSLGINDVPGFRRGMIWPFQPFDRSRKSILPILEIPPTLMDGGIFYRPIAFEEGCRKIKEHVALAFKYDGAVVFDWHMEQLNAARLHGAGPALVSVLRELAQDSDVYWASPAEAASWWNLRRQQIKERAV